MTKPKADSESIALLGMAQQLRDAEIEREKSIRPFRRRYDRARNDLRMPPEKRAKVAAEFVRAAHYADHVYTERIEGGHEDYLRVIIGDEESRLLDHRGTGNPPVV
jgi:hypothetical protein